MHTAYGEMTNGARIAPPDRAALDLVAERIRDGLVQEGMKDLLPLLQAWRLDGTDGTWARRVSLCLEHPLRDLLHQDPFTRRAFVKPRGYAGDAELLDYIYGREEGWPIPPGTSELGRQLFDFTTRSSACEGVRARRGFVAECVDRLAEERHRPHVLSVAAGHLREAALSSAVKRRRLGRYVALDADAESLREVEHCYGFCGVETCHAHVRAILAGRVRLGTFDLAYTTSLLDYLQESAGRRLTLAMFEMLRPGGRLVLANFLPGILDVGYMESYMGWTLIYRTRQDMIALAAHIPQADLRDIRIFAEENQNIIFLELTKK